MVTCPLVPGAPPLVSGACASPRAFGLGFLQTSPRDGALALLLACGSANTWRGDLHPTSSVPGLAHTPGLRRAVYRVGSRPLLGLHYFGCFFAGFRIPLPLDCCWVIVTDQLKDVDDRIYIHKI